MRRRSCSCTISMTTPCPATTSLCATPWIISKTTTCRSPLASSCAKVNSQTQTNKQTAKWSSRKLQDGKELLEYLWNSRGINCLREFLSTHAFKLCISGFQAKQDFLNESNRVFDSEPAVLENLQQINDWVDNATNGKITDFLSSLPANMLLMLINAVHYKGTMCNSLYKLANSWPEGADSLKVPPSICHTFFPSTAGEWKAQFDPRFTSRGVFYLDDEQMVEVEVMEDAKHPLSLFFDNDLEAQVKKKKATKNNKIFLNPI